MVGFVGVQARKRKRNRIIFISVILFMIVTFFYLPTLDFTTEEKELPNEILPDTVDDKSSLISEIEELKLEIFQKDQRIKFRDNQIKDLKEEAKNAMQLFASLELEYNKTKGNVSKLENNLSENSSENSTEIKNLKDKIRNLNNLIDKHKEQITKLNQDINNSISAEDLEKINIENSILKNEIILIKEKNLKAEILLEELKLLLVQKQKEIDKLLYLKDVGHHG